MGRKYKVISADGHVETPPDVFVKYVPEKWKDRAPRLIHLPEGGEGWLIEGQPLLRNGQNIAGRDKVKFSGGTYFNADGSPAEGAGPAEQRLREQDLDGIDAEVLFPPVFASRFLEGIKDPEVYRSMIRAYNTFLAHDYCSVAPDRLIGNAVIPISGVDHAVEELEFIAAAGLPSVAFYNFPNGTPYADPADDRFWEKSLELGLKQLIAAGVLERFPDIKFYFAETNASWLPGTLYFMDDNYELFGDWFNVSYERKPSEQIKDHFHFSVIRDPVVFDMADIIPWDNIMWGSDFPHSVGSYPDSQEYIAEHFPKVDESIAHKVLVENPVEYFDLDIDADITETPAA